MPKFSVLTILMGDYDKLHEIKPNEIIDNVEYICVTDNKSLESSSWKIIYDHNLDVPELNGFDRTFMVRYNPFKYCTSNICLRIDSSFEPRYKILDMVNFFIEQDYDIGINLHPSRLIISEELQKWKYTRKVNQINLQTNYISTVFSEDMLNMFGLYQVGLQILKKSPIIDELNKDMLNILRDCSPNKPHMNRLDQTLFSALINYKYGNSLNVMPISWDIINNEYLIHYFHKKNIPTKIKQKVDYFFNGRKVEVFEGDK